MYAQNFEMKVCCIGAGHVGGPMCAVMALKCPEVMIRVADKNSELIAKWNSEKLPIYEPDLEKAVKQCRNANLHFSTDMKTAIEEAELIFIAVDTPTKSFGNGKGRAVDLRHVESAARMIAEVAQSNKIVVEKSTVPVRAAERIKHVLSANQKPGVRFDILSSPEFLAGDAATADLLCADRVLIGGEKTPEGRRAVEKLSWIYEHWIPKENLLTTSTWSAELSKLAANAFLAQRLSSINSVTALCEASRADVAAVTRVIGSDARIGSKFLEASIGFGSGCFQKDVLNLVYICECLSLHEVAAYWQKVIQMNEYQKSRFSQQIIESLFNNVSDKRISILGFALEKKASDIREAPAISVCRTLLEEGAKLNIYDVEIEPEQILSTLTDLHCTKSPDLVKLNIQLHSDPYTAVSGTHAIAICSKWDEFPSLDYERIYHSMLKPAFIFDSSKVLDHQKLQQIGFNVQTIGQ